jgi:hypothetical protein
MQFSVPKLLADGSNWVTYCDHITWALELQTLEVYLTRDTLPKDYAYLGTVTGLNAPTHWRHGEGIVKQLIASTMPDTIFNRIKGGTHSKNVWDALKNLYEDHTHMMVVDLARKVRSKKCGETESICMHFKQLADMHEQLAAMGKTVDDDDYTDILLASLPPLYNFVCSTINASAHISKEKLTPHTVMQLMADKYKHHTTKNKNNSQDKAFATDAKCKKKNIECFNCKKCGNVKADCWAKGGGKEGQGPHHKGKAKAKDDASTAEEATDIKAWAAIEVLTSEEEDWETDTSQYDAVIAVSNTCTHVMESKLYDSGASSHMSPFCHQFMTYHSIEPCAICPADKCVFYAIRTGDLQINIPCGESLTPILLKDALHAPDIGLTIVSISHIIKAGCDVTFGSNNCTIKNNAGHTVLSALCLPMPKGYTALTIMMTWVQPLRLFPFPSFINNSGILHPTLFICSLNKALLQEFHSVMTTPCHPAVAIHVSM